MDSSPTARIGLVLHPRRTPASAVARIATWTATHGVELVASADDVARADAAGVTAVPPEVLAGTCDGGRTRLPRATRRLAAGPCRRPALEALAAGRAHRIPPLRSARRWPGSW